jgi:putative ABC transport system permease protein
MDLHGLTQDVAYAARTMRRAPAFTAIAVLTLAAGIGVNTAMFSVVNAVLLRPLPYAHADSVFAVWNVWKGTDQGGLSIPEYLDFRERLRSADLAVTAGGSDNLTDRGEPQRLVFTAVTSNWLSVFGITPALGRSFELREERPGNDDVVMLTDPLWRTLFNADPAAIGQTMRLGGRTATIIGVLPRGFALPYQFGSVERSSYLRPLVLDPAAPRDQRGNHFLAAFARPRAGATAAQAATEIAALARGFVDEYRGEYDAEYSARLVPLHREVVGNASRALLILLAAVCLVLLIACANVANLLLARSHVRGREMAVRKAVGATASRLARQVLTESVVLAMVSGAVGLVIANALVAIAIASAPVIPRLDETTLDLRVLAFTAIVSITTAVLFGSVPALHLARADAAVHLEGGRGVRSGLRAGLGGALVSVQVALALVLLVGAALLLHSFSRLLRVPAGFNPERVLTLNVSIPLEGYEERQHVVGFFEQVLERVRSTSGVVAAGAIGRLPLRGGVGDWDVYLEGEVPTSSGSDRPTEWQVVTPGYFEAMGIRLARGRFPALTDRANSPAVVIINDAFARMFFRGIDPIGRQIRMSGDDRPWMSIVGVAGDVRQVSLDRPSRPEVYIPHGQFRPYWDDSSLRAFTVIVRSSVEPIALAGAVRRHMRELDANIPIATVTTMEEVIVRSLADRRLHLILLGTFAALALVLALVGTYGVLAYRTSERTRELGIRIALGASGHDVLATVLRQGMMPVAAGVVLGLTGAAAVTRAMTSLLFDTAPLDPAIFAGVAGLLLASALVACAVPARRAMRVDPGIALRVE